MVLNKRGETEGKAFSIFLWAVVILFVVWVIWSFGSSYNSAADQGPVPELLSFLIPGDVNLYTESQNLHSYEEVLRSHAFKPLDYILGGIPDYLIRLTDNPNTDANFVSAIIMIGIWVILLLTFFDIFSTFGFYGNKGIAWVIAAVLTIIAANLKVIIVLAVSAMILTSFLGALSAFASIIVVLFVFLAFHAGTSKLRQRVIIRRAEDTAMRAAAGGTKAAAGIEILKDIVSKAGKGE